MMAVGTFSVFRMRAVTGMILRITAQIPPHGHEGFESFRSHAVTGPVLPEFFLFLFRTDSLFQGSDQLGKDLPELFLFLFAEAAEEVPFFVEFGGRPAFFR